VVGQVGFTCVLLIGAGLLAHSFQIEIVDLLQDPRRVLSDTILATPTLIKLSPAPVRKIIGDLGEEAKVLRALGLQQRTT